MASMNTAGGVYKIDEIMLQESALLEATLLEATLQEGTLLEATWRVPYRRRLSRRRPSLVPLDSYWYPPGGYPPGGQAIHYFGAGNPHTIILAIVNLLSRSLRLCQRDAQVFGHVRGEVLFGHDVGRPCLVV